jgi:long-chain acyl-CoA synthetase
MSSYEDALYSLTLGLLGGFACNCPEAPDSVLRDLREIGPTILFLPTAACNALAQVLSSKVEAATGFKRRSFTFFQRLALEAEACREQERAVPLGLAVGCRIGELVAYAPARDQLGLSRVRWVHTDGPLPPGTTRLLRSLGVALRPADVRAIAPKPAQANEALHA